MNPTVFPPLNAERLNARVEQLARFTRADVPWTRRAFSPLFTEARAWLAAQFAAAGLAVSMDAAGNLIGRREGSGRCTKPLITGSHCDTVVGGGRFDGIIGVLAGIEVAHTLNEQGIVLDHPLEVIDFLSEEPSDYGISCVGSRALSGVLDAGMLRATNGEGETLAQALTRIGGKPEALNMPLRAPGSTAAFVELHIEQGPVLEARGLPIGVVTNIVGIRRVLITVIGQPDHAGTTPMDIRRDALVGAAHLIEAAHARALSLSGNPHYVVATIGRIAMTPNVPNAVPGQVELMLEVRSDSDAVLDAFPETLLAGAAAQLDVAVERARGACEPRAADRLPAARNGRGRAGGSPARLPEHAFAERRGARCRVCRADRADRDDLHSVPGWAQPLLGGMDRAAAVARRHARAVPDARRARSHAGSA